MEKRKLWITAGVVALAGVAFWILSCSGPARNPVMESVEVGVSVGDGDISGRAGPSEADVDIVTGWVSVHPFAGMGSSAEPARAPLPPAPVAPPAPVEKVTDRDSLEDEEMASAAPLRAPPPHAAANPTPSEPEHHVPWWEDGAVVERLITLLIGALMGIGGDRKVYRPLKARRERQRG